LSELLDTGLASHSAIALRDALANGQVSISDVVKAHEDRIDEREDEVGAWQVRDPQFVTRQVRALQALPDDKRGPLFGLPVGVKDVFDTKDLPTAYGSEIYAGNQPAADAACVARLREAGAVIMGKTVSTEFAYWKAGKTRNPLDLARSPGGSSSGSAAAVACGMAPLAIGSQTAASTIRPAAYCGIVGFKPTRGLISLAGVKALANSLDTVGVFGRNVADASLITAVMADNPAMMALKPTSEPPRIAVLKAPEWHMADDSAKEVVYRVGNRAEEAGALMRKGNVPAAFAPLADVQTRIMAFEATRELAHERCAHSDQLSRPLRELFEQGETISSDEYAADRGVRETCFQKIEALFEDAEVLLAPSTLATAPLLDQGTGSPDLSRTWTLLGMPSITIPCGKGEHGLPLGLQIASRPDADHLLLQVACWFETLLSTAE
jgi:Asp-tRNA(Asn)/Glu-tRNA(Gln) amidotransferase A subunit family amidase